MSQATLATRIGERQQFISKYESCERRLDVVEFVTIASALSVDWIKLLHWPE